MSAMVWILMLYSAVTVTLLTITEGIPVYLGMIYDILCAMALACHAKTSLSDPGSVPLAAIPSERQRLIKDSHSMCGQCQTFKPPMSHHCRICNRCVSRMDHHCPWMNNCVGAHNLSTFRYVSFYFVYLLYIYLPDITKDQTILTCLPASIYYQQNTFSFSLFTLGRARHMLSVCSGGTISFAQMRTVPSTPLLSTWFVV